MEYKDKKYTYLGGLMHGISTLATGMKTSIKVYFRKKVTEQYPENRKELKMFDRFRGTRSASSVSMLVRTMPSRSTRTSNMQSSTGRNLS